MRKIRWVVHAVIEVEGYESSTPDMIDEHIRREIDALNERMTYRLGSVHISLGHGLPEVLGDE